jgi:excisionase family DNA binding protein
VTDVEDWQVLEVVAAEVRRLEAVQQQQIEALKQQQDTLFKKLEATLAKPEVGYFTTTEAAVFVGCSRTHIRRHVTGGTLPVSNIGTNDGPDYRVSRADLIAWMGKRMSGAFPPVRRKKAAPAEQSLPFSSHRRASKHPGSGV